MREQGHEETSMTTAADAIHEAMAALGGEAEARDVRAWVDARYPGRWADITVQMADLTYPGNASSTYPVQHRFLERVERGRYRLR
jgi:hypothetical protein